MLHVALHVPALRFGDLQLLLDEHLLALHGVEALLCHARRVFDLRQALCFVLAAVLAHRHAHGGIFLLLLPVRAQGAQTLQLRLLLGDLALAVLYLLRQAVALFDQERDLLLQPRHFGIGRVQLALLGMQRIGQAEMFAARAFQLAFDFAQFGDLGFQVVPGLLDLLRETRPPGFGLLLVHQPQQALRSLAPRFQLAKGLRHFGLLAQMHQLLVEFLQDVGDAQQVVARIAQAQLGLAAAVAVFGDPGRFLKEYAQLFRLGLDDARDHALLDDGIGTRTDAGTEEDVGDVLAAHRLVVDVVAGIAVALQYALDGDFGVGRPLPADLA